MEKVVIIEGREIRLKVHGNIPNMYYAQFGEDLFVEIEKMNKSKNISLALFNNFLWTCAKAADKDILPPDEWFASFESMPILHCLEEVKELFEKLFPQGKLKTKAQKATKR